MAWNDGMASQKAKHPKAQEADLAVTKWLRFGVCSRAADPSACM